MKLRNCFYEFTKLKLLNTIRLFRREKTVLQLTFLLISNFFQRKPFGLLSLSFSSLFQQRTNMGEVFYYQKHAKPLEQFQYITQNLEIHRRRHRQSLEKGLTK